MIFYHRRHSLKLFTLAVSATFLSLSLSLVESTLKLECIHDIHTWANQNSHIMKFDSMLMISKIFLQWMNLMEIFVIIVTVVLNPTAIATNIHSFSIHSSICHKIFRKNICRALNSSENEQERHARLDFCLWQPQAQ